MKQTINKHFLFQPFQNTIGPMGSEIQKIRNFHWLSRHLKLSSIIWHIFRNFPLFHIKESSEGKQGYTLLKSQPRRYCHALCRTTRENFVFGRYFFCVFDRESCPDFVQSNCSLYRKRN